MSRCSGSPAFVIEGFHVHRVTHRPIVLVALFISRPDDRFFVFLFFFDGKFNERCDISAFDDPRIYLFTLLYPSDDQI